MAVSASDIKVYGSAAVAENNTVATGGAIDTTLRYVFDDSTLANTLNDTVEVVSSAAGDTTQTVTITGRNTGGSIISEVIALNGITVVNGTTTFARILKIVVSAAHAGTITVRKAVGDTTIVAIETGVLTIRRLFYDASADASGGVAREFHEKIFVKNTHATESLLGATFEENADPTGRITFALEDAVNDIGSVANRLTAPIAGDLASGGFSSASKLLSTIDAGTADLVAGAAIAVWCKLTLAAGDTASNSTWTLRVSGTSV